MYRSSPFRSTLNTSYIRFGQSKVLRNHTLHMPKPNVTRVQSASEWTASVHALHMPKPNVTRVQSATQWIAFFLDNAALVVTTVAVMKLC